MIRVLMNVPKKANVKMDPICRKKWSCTQYIRARISFRMTPHRLQVIARIENNGREKKIEKIRMVKFNKILNG
jgi:hypothetical protein